MKTFMTALLLLVWAPSIQAQESINKDENSSEESLFVEALILTEKMAQILEGVKDKDSAKVAASQIEALVPQAMSIKKKAQKEGINKLKKEERLKLIQKYNERMRKATSSIILMSKRLGSFPEIAAAMTKIKVAMN